MDKRYKPIGGMFQGVRGSTVKGGGGNASKLLKLDANGYIDISCLTDDLDAVVSGFRELKNLVDAINVTYASTSDLGSLANELRAKDSTLSANKADKTTVTTLTTRVATCETLSEAAKAASDVATANVAAMQLQVDTLASLSSVVDELYASVNDSEYNGIRTAQEQGDADLQRQLDSLAASTRTSITAVESSVGLLSESIGSLGTTITTLNTSVATLSNNLSALQVVVSGESADDRNSLVYRTNTLETKISTLETEILTPITGLKPKVSVLETEVADLKLLEPRVDELEKTITCADRDIFVLQEQVYALNVQVNGTSDVPGFAGQFAALKSLVETVIPSDGIGLRLYRDDGQVCYLRVSDRGQLYTTQPVSESRWRSIIL